MPPIEIVILFSAIIVLVFALGIVKLLQIIDNEHYKHRELSATELMKKKIKKSLWDAMKE